MDPDRQLVNNSTEAESIVIALMPYLMPRSPKVETPSFPGSTTGFLQIDKSSARSEGQGLWQHYSYLSSALNFFAWLCKSLIFQSLSIS